MRQGSDDRTSLFADLNPRRVGGPVVNVYASIILNRYWF